MNLKEKRTEWEKDLDVLLILPSVTGAYVTVYVMLQHPDGSYLLHRYFIVDDSWQCSVDLTEASESEVRHAINKAFAHNIPVAESFDKGFCCTKCGHNEFIGHQVQRFDVIVDGHNNWHHNDSCYDSDTVFGPYACRKCGTVFEELKIEAAT